MQNIRKVTEDIYWVGASDRRLALFENLFPVDRGISYNSFVILDEKTALMDTVDSSITDLFLENVEAALAGRTLDYLVIHHMEPDHCANIEEIVRRYPEVKLVGNKSTFSFFEQFYPMDASKNYYPVKKNDELNLGAHTLKFTMTPNVHWPEVMMSYDLKDKILFSADAFGCFAPIDGNLFINELDFDQRILAEARRYYVNIVGHYGKNVLSALKKLSAFEIDMILPLHGPGYSGELIERMLHYYQTWGAYLPEEKSALLLYGSMYGNTENAVDILAGKLAEKGVANIKIVDISRTDPSYIMADIFKYSNLVFAGTNYNTGLYIKMDNVIREALHLEIKDRKISFIRNGTWGGKALEIMQNYFSDEKRFTIVGEPVEIHSSVKDGDLAPITELADAIAASILKEEE